MTASTEFCLLSAVFCLAVFYFVFNYRVSFNNKGLSKKQKIIASLTMAIITAPYTFLLPKELFIRNKNISRFGTAIAVITGKYLFPILIRALT